MEQYLKAFHAWQNVDPTLRQIQATAIHYLTTGDPADLTALASSKDQTLALVRMLSELLPPPAKLDESDRRALALIASCSRGDDHRLLRWATKTPDSEPDGETFGIAGAALRDAGFTETQIDSLAMLHLAYEESSEKSVVGAYIAGTGLPRIAAALNHSWAACPGFYRTALLRGLVTVCLEHAPALVDPLVDLLRSRFRNEKELCSDLLNWFGARFEPPAAAFFHAQPDTFELGMKLFELNPDRYRQAVVKRLPEQLQSMTSRWYVERNMSRLGSHAISAYVEYFCNGGVPFGSREDVNAIFESLVKHGGDQAKPGLLSILQGSPAPFIQSIAARHLIAMQDPALTEALETAIEKGMTGEARDAALFAALAAGFTSASLRERLWQDLSAKSKVRRAAAADALAAGDPQALDRAAGLLSEKAKEARWGAVTLLAKLKSPPAIDCLLHWLPREPAEEIRDDIARALREAGVSLEAIVKQLGPIDFDKLRAAAEKITDYPVKWLGPNDLPPLVKVDGQPLDAALVRYMLHRQSRQKEPVVDPETAPLYALIDRRKSGDFAIKLLTAYLEADAGKPDAWIMITAGLLGDNRVITTLTTKARAWAQDFSQKLGEFAIEALAINGSDAALMAVESIATKFKDNPRRKFKVIGEAAQNAIDRAAKRLGISIDELGDRIVPSMGFEPGRPRIIEAGKRRIEATVGLDFKLSMKDLDTGKRAVSIPKTAAPEVVAEFKGLGKLLQEVAKSQAIRLENLMIARHRWPVNRWRELFLQHPILFPFAVRLVWASFDQSGNVLQTFRALPDRSLTDFGDEPVELPAEPVNIGIPHPLDLSSEQVGPWREHLIDYEIESPFPQIDRPVARVQAGQAELKMYESLKGSQLNALGFRSKAERAGWTRGHGDGPMIAAYRKRFSNLRIDTFVTVEGMPAYTDPTAQVTIGGILFLPIDATPRDFQTALLPLGQVPAMAYSEAIGDMQRICGRAQT